MIKSSKQFNYRGVITGTFAFAISLAALATPAQAAIQKYQVTDLGGYTNPNGWGPGGALTASGNVALSNNLGQAGNWVDHAFLYSKGTLTDLGTLGTDSSYSSDMNAAGQVVGFANMGYGWHGFVYSKGFMKDLGTLGGTDCIATRINAAGQVIGLSTTVTGVQHGFIYSQGVMTDLGALSLPQSFCDSTFVYDLNDSGEVVGESYLQVDASGFVDRAVLYSKGKLINLGTLQGVLDSNSGATKINNAGQVIGWSSTPDDGGMHGFIYSKGVMKDIGTLGGGESWALDINNAGQVVGWSYTPDNEEVHAFIYSNGVMKDLGISGYALATSINASGQVVGTQWDQPFVYSNGQTQLLSESLVPSAPVCYLQYPIKINDAGEILVIGSNADGEAHAYLLTPEKKAN